MSDSILRPGCYPASVTPFRTDGEVDQPGMARLLAHFEASECAGVVIAGTNGEGASLSAIEKRDLLRSMMAVRGNLDLILGIATPSLTEAIWSCNQAAKVGACAGLVMAPSYFREASEEGIYLWFRALMDASDLPILIYNFPQRTGFTLSADLLGRLADHANLAGAKDSSGDIANLKAYASAIPGKALFVGNETLLIDALAAGWTGTISGAANVIPQWLASIVRLFHAGESEQANLKFELVLPVLEAFRKSSQPGTNKALLAKLGILDSPRLRLPLSEPTDIQAAAIALKTLG